MATADENLHAPKQDGVLPFESDLDAFRGAGAQISKIRDLVRRIAVTELSALIVGEPGTGKSSLARAIHQLSVRRSGPFVQISSGNVPRELASAELFGFVKGAFTGAVRTRAGLVETAEGGTLYLDGLEDASLEMQALLLGFVADRRFTKLGASREQTADVRLISSVRPDALNSLRPDLRDRLSGVVINIPPLRSHPEDIPELAETVVRTLGTHIISDNAMKRMMSYSFPGNVRELQAALQRAVVLASSSTIQEEDLGLEERLTSSSGVATDTLQAELREAHGQLDVYQRAAIIASPIWQGRNFTPEPDYCFVLMPFSSTRDLPAVYDNHVKLVLERCGLRCERADDIHDISGIMQSVWESINRARLIVAEMTERNPNVFYELGIAHTLGKQVIMITQSMDFVPFDLKHLRCIVYDYKPNRIEQFEAALEKTVKTVLSSSQAPSLSLIRGR
jgi:energy-coupling factor transporter ATP-binding protein EcfA2